MMHEAMHRVKLFGGEKKKKKKTNKQKCGDKKKFRVSIKLARLLLPVVLRILNGAVVTWKIAGTAEDKEIPEDSRDKNTKGASAFKVSILQSRS